MMAHHSESAVLIAEQSGHAARFFTQQPRPAFATPAHSRPVRSDEQLVYS